MYQQQAAEPFILTVENISAVAKGFYLSQGLLYTRGAETAGQLRTGDFPAIGETSGRSLIASTSNSITIEQFIAYCQANPTYVPLIQITSTNATAQLKQIMQWFRQGMIKNEIPFTVPFRKYASGEQYNLQFQNILEPLYIGPNEVLAVRVAAASIITLNIYPLITKNTETLLRDDVRNAKLFTEGIAAPTFEVAQGIKYEAITSNLNRLLQMPEPEPQLLS